MKTITILACYSSWHLLLVFFFGMIVMAIIAFVIWQQEKQTMKEKKDLLKLTHAIQRYYWLVKKGKSVEANQKALKKFISVFSNRVINSSPSAVEYALSSFRVGVFSNLRTKIYDVYHMYKAQFHQKSDFNTDEPVKLVSPVEFNSFISDEDAVNRIQKVFEDSDVK